MSLFNNRTHLIVSLNGQPNITIKPVAQIGGGRLWGFRYTNNKPVNGYVEYDGANITFSPFTAHLSNGLSNCLDAPAMVLRRLNTLQPFSMYWAVNGKIHREDGPALIDLPNDHYYYLNDERLTLAQFYERQKHTIHATKIMALLLASKHQ